MEIQESTQHHLSVRVANLFKPSWVLILSNCAPLFGFFFLDWDVFQTVFLYWLESAVVGLFTMVLLYVKPISPEDRAGVPINAKIILIPFFFLHFGGFMVAHLFLIMFFLGNPDSGSLVHQAVQAFRDTPAIGWALLSALFSYAYSFVTNDILTKNYLQPLRKENLSEIMIKPYRRIFIMQFTVLISAFGILLLRLPQPMVVALIVVKTFFDLRAYGREHSRAVARV